MKKWVQSLNNKDRESFLEFCKKTASPVQIYLFSRFLGFQGTIVECNEWSTKEFKKRNFNQVLEIEIDNWLVHLVNNKGAAARPCETLYLFSSRLLRWRSTSVASSRLSPPHSRMLSLVVTRFCLPENILEYVPLLEISRRGLFRE